MMNFIDIWAIISGLASFASLFLVMKDKFPKWRKYILSSGYILAGFAIGRVSIALLPGAIGSAHEIRFMGFFLILLVFFGVPFLIFLKMAKKYPDWNGAILIIVIISMAVPSLLDKYNETFPDIPKEDYLLLSNIKEEKTDIAGAVKYLERYRSLLSDKRIIEQVDEKIFKLQEIQM